MKIETQKHRRRPTATYGVREWNATFKGSQCRSLGRLEHVKDEMVAPMVPSVGRILIIPVAVVNRDLSFGSIAIVHAIAAAVVLIPVKVLWVVDVRVVVEA
jgi:hypothetical protein